MGNEKRCEDCRHAHTERPFYATHSGLRDFGTYLTCGLYDRRKVATSCTVQRQDGYPCGPSAELFEPKQGKSDER